MYGFFLAIHNILRWVVLVLLVVAVVRALMGLFGEREWTATDRKVGLFSTIAVDTQLLVGLILYFVYSPITTAALRDFSAAMGVSNSRFFAVEHVFFMVLVLVFAHLGSTLTKRKEGSKAKHTQAAIWFGLALLLVILGIPWGRPLLPGLG
jgi:hypothetical protein